MECEKQSTLFRNTFGINCQVHIAVDVLGRFNHVECQSVAVSTLSLIQEVRGSILIPFTGYRDRGIVFKGLFYGVSV
jgi:hypothetical protein